MTNRQSNRNEPTQRQDDQSDERMRSGADDVIGMDSETADSDEDDFEDLDDADDQDEDSEGNI